MPFELYYHPLASYCWKALIALYEAEVPFEKHLVDLGDPKERAAFLELTPLGKFPLLRDTASNRCIAESSILIEYLALGAPSAARLFPRSAELLLEVRARDRFFDLYVMEPMAKIVEDKLRPEAECDTRGVAAAHARLDTAYEMAERFLGTTGWAVGSDFSLADCAAAPGLVLREQGAPVEFCLAADEILPRAAGSTTEFRPRATRSGTLYVDVSGLVGGRLHSSLVVPRARAIRTMFTPEERELCQTSVRSIVAVYGSLLGLLLRCTVGITAAPADHPGRFRNLTKFFARSP